jgi:hypothetical protein
LLSLVIGLHQKQGRSDRCVAGFITFEGHTAYAGAYANSVAGPKGERHGWHESKKQTKENAFPGKAKSPIHCCG